MQLKFPLLQILPSSKLARILIALIGIACSLHSEAQSPRERILINDGWRFFRYTSDPDKLVYDIRPEVSDRNDNIVADSKPTESIVVSSS
ncbi:MAG: hypothetical protein EOO00_10850, partial [Chitinophagaceae bacterium]